MAADTADQRTRPIGSVAFAARPRLATRLVPNFLVRRFATSAGEILLTFDDGPHPEYTPQVLDRLAAFGVRAGFFLLGRNVVRSPRLVKQIAATGHLVGNHSFHHRPHRPEVAACQGEIERACDVRPAWYRPPFGRLTPMGLAAAWRCGLRVMTWSLDANDWQCRSLDDALTCAAAVVRESRPGDVVLLHDGHPWIATILDAALPGLRMRGLL